MNVTSSTAMAFQAAAPRKANILSQPRLTPVIDDVLYYPGVCLRKEVFLADRRAMAHTIRDKKQLLHRIRRIRGQVEGVERAIEQERDCSEILQTIAACRGAINGLMAEVIEGHMRFHVVDPNHKPTSAQAKAAQQLMDVVKRYLR